MRSFSQQKESGCRRRDEYAMMMGAASSNHGRTRPTRRRTRRRGRLSSRRRRRRRRSSLVVSRRRGSGGRRRGRVVSHLGDDVMCSLFSIRRGSSPAAPLDDVWDKKAFSSGTKTNTKRERRCQNDEEREWWSNACASFFAKASKKSILHPEEKQRLLWGRMMRKKCMYKCAGKMNTQKESLCYYYYEDCLLCYAYSARYTI